jgi:hypothetical protein
MVEMRKHGLSVTGQNAKCVRDTFQGFRVDPLEGVIDIVGVVLQKETHPNTLEDAQEHVDP